MIGAQAVGPSLHRLVIDHVSRLDVDHCLARQAATLLLLLNPSAQCLLDHPSARTLKTGGQLVHPVGQRSRHMCSENFGFRLSHFVSL